MARLSFYVSAEVAEALRARAAAERESLSKCVTEIVKREMPELATPSGWPEGYFEEVVGSWKGEFLQRPPQEEL
jgi:hypothetical protein